MFLQDLVNTSVLLEHFVLVLDNLLLGRRVVDLSWEPVFGFAKSCKIHKNLVLILAIPREWIVDAHIVVEYLTWDVICHLLCVLHVA